MYECSVDGCSLHAVTHTLTLDGLCVPVCRECEGKIVGAENTTLTRTEQAQILATARAVAEAVRNGYENAIEELGACPTCGGVSVQFERVLLRVCRGAVDNSLLPPFLEDEGNPTQFTLVELVTLTDLTKSAIRVLQSKQGQAYCAEILHGFYRREKDLRVLLEKLEWLYADAEPA